MLTSKSFQVTTAAREDPLQPAPPTSTNTIRARWGTSAIFFLNGFVFASWVLHVPTVRDKFQLSPAVLGLALLAAAAGSLLTMPVTGALIARYGSRPVTRAFALLNPVTLLPLLLAPSFPAQLAVLALYGGMTGGLDVAMNAQGVAVERALRRPVLSSFHAAWSLGGVAGSALGSLLLAAHVSATAHVTGVAAVLSVVAVLAGVTLLPPRHDLREHETGEGARRGLSPLLWLLGLLGFLGLLGEGAIADWSTIYARDVLNATPGLSGLGYVAFAAAMTIGRLLGDTARARLGGQLVLRGGALLAALGLLLALAMPTPWLAAIGFAACGLGIANIVPVLFDAAARQGQAGPAIAQVSTISYLGFLAGPPLVGFVAEAAGLGLALSVVAGLVGLIAVLGALAWRSGRTAST